MSLAPPTSNTPLQPKRVKKVNWHGKKILVLGAGDTGLSVVRWAKRMGAHVRIADSRDTPPAAAQLQREHPDVPLDCGPWQRHRSLLGDAELIVASPGVAVAGPACDPAIEGARAAGKTIVGDIELFAWQQKQLTAARADKKAPHVIGITGSNGKSTVTAMVGAMCAAAGLKTVVAGNIGLPVLDALMEAEQGNVPDCYVLELSSFQMETTASLQLSAATMLNLSQDHLDRYASMADYAAAKQRIFRHARHQVLNRDDAVSLAMRDTRLPVTTFGLDAPATEEDVGLAQGALMAGYEALMPLAEMPVAGLHNAANAGAAYALCRALGLPQAALIDGLKHFKGLPHRVEQVGIVNGVVFYDDSKGTNVGATVAALNGMTQPVILIAGGDGKQQDFTPLARPTHERTKAVVLIGRDAAEIERAVYGTASENGPNSAKRPIHAASMMDAVEKAYSCASPGDAVLLSPACASFDMFKNYKHRGEVFAQSVAALQAQQARLGGEYV